MRFLSAITVALCMVGTSLADPPTLDIPPEIVANSQYVSFTPKTDAKSVVYIGLSGVDPFPSEMLKDSRSFLLTAGGLKPAIYKFTAIAIKDNEFTRRDFTIKVGNPQPTPIDPPFVPVDPPIDPKLDDAPVSTNGLYVVIVNETGNKITQPQFNVMYGETTRKWLDANCVEWRIIDQDSVPASEPWKSIVKRARTTIPWLIAVHNKKYVYEKPLSPTVTVNEVIAALSPYKPVAAKGQPKAQPKAQAPKVVSEVTTSHPFSQEENLSTYNRSLQPEDIGLVTIALTVEDWKHQFQDGQRETDTYTDAKITDVLTNTEPVPTGNIRYQLYQQYQYPCANGNCSAPQSTGWYPGKLIGR